jgi:hypothetical protein
MRNHVAINGYTTESNGVQYHKCGTNPSGSSVMGYISNPPYTILKDTSTLLTSHFRKSSRVLRQLENTA